MREFRKDESTADLRDLFVQMVDSSDWRTPKTGLTVAAEICKAGASSYAAIAGSVSEIGDGTYKVALDAGDLDTEGQAQLQLTSTGAAPQFIQLRVVDYSRIWEVLASVVTGATSIGGLIKTNVAACAAALAGFTGVGVETVQGYLNALADSGSTKPTGWASFTASRDPLNRAGATLEDVQDRAEVLQSTLNSVIAQNPPLYHCKIQHLVDDPNSRDEWTVALFQNNHNILTYRSVSEVRIKVTARSTGSTLIASTIMTKVGTAYSNVWKYDASALERLPAGETGIVNLEFDSDGVTYYLVELVGRDAVL